jgi:ABC-2 type transport system ATP-binding protein
MIEVLDVRKRFGPVQAVRGVSFAVARGEALALLGPNGAGKTTTIRMITGALPPTSGAVRVDGLDSVHDSIAVRRRLGYMPESTPLYTEMRTADYLAYRARLFSIPRSARRAAIDRSIDRCRLADVRTRRIGALSKGYRQRVGLAAALLHDPPAVVLDEPTSGLDPSQIVEVRALIRELARDKAVILSSHILPEVEKTCDRVVVVAQGLVRASGAVADLLRSSACIVEIVGADAPSARAALAALPGVATVHAQASPHARFRVEATGDAAALAPSIGALALAQRWTLRELSIARPTLETLFTSLVAEAHPAGAAAA